MTQPVVAITDKVVPKKGWYFKGAEDLKSATINLEVEKVTQPVPPPPTPSPKNACSN